MNIFNINNLIFRFLEPTNMSFLTTYDHIKLCQKQLKVHRLDRFFDLFIKTMFYIYFNIDIINQQKDFITWFQQTNQWYLKGTKSKMLNFWSAYVEGKKV